MKCEVFTHCPRSCGSQLFPIIRHRHCEKNHDILVLGAFYGILLGHLCGIARLVVELVYPAPPCGEEDTRTAFLSKLHFSYFVQLQLLFTATMITLISLCTQRRTDKELQGLTWWTRYTPLKPGQDIDAVGFDLPVIKANGNRVPETPGKNKQDSLVKSNMDADSYQEDDTRSCCRSWFNQICGLHVDVNVEEKLDLTHIRHFLFQSTKARHFLNAGAVFLLMAVTFITGFYH